MIPQQPHELAPWPKIHPGDRVLLRSRAGTSHDVITVAHVAPAINGDGPRLTDIQGRSYQHYYYAADLTVSAREISESIDALAETLEAIRAQLLDHRADNHAGDDR